MTASACALGEHWVAVPPLSALREQVERPAGGRLDQRRGGGTTTRLWGDILANGMLHDG